jgi:hypothetical protein
MSKSDTLPNGGIGISEAQSAISSLLAAQDGDNQAPESDEALQADEDSQVDDSDADESEVTGDNGEASEDPDTDDSESDDGADPDEAEDQPKEIVVDIDGKPVTVDELKKGYLRQSDYTRKTQQVAEERKSLETELSVIRAERSQYEQLLPALQQQLYAMASQEPDWETLYQQDPIGAIQEERKWRVQTQQRQEQLAAIQAEQERLNQLRRGEQVKQFEHHLTQERELLLERLPSWKDAKVATTERAKVKEYAQKLGFTADELDAVTDHRAVIGLYKAMKYDEMLAKRNDAKPRQTVPVAKPGSAAVGKVASEANRDRQRLAKTGRVQDAARLIEKLL